jgi:hypothetical protein
MRIGNAASYGYNVIKPPFNLLHKANGNLLHVEKLVGENVVVPLLTKSIGLAKSIGTHVALPAAKGIGTHVALPAANFIGNRLLVPAARASVNAVYDGAMALGPAITTAPVLGNKILTSTINAYEHSKQNYKLAVQAGDNEILKALHEKKNAEYVLVRLQETGRTLYISFKWDDYEGTFSFQYPNVIPKHLIERVAGRWTIRNEMNDTADYIKTDNGAEIEGMYQRRKFNLSQQFLPTQFILSTVIN